MVLLCCIERPNHRVCLPVTQGVGGPALVIEATAPEQWLAITILAAFVELASQLSSATRQMLVDVARQQIDQLALPDGIELRILEFTVDSTPI